MRRAAGPTLPLLALLIAVAAESAHARSLDRRTTFNDPQVGVEAGAAGRAQDRNVELPLPDPRGR